MNTLDLIKNRRSVRKYKPAMPSDEEIASVIEAGRWAPSGLNNQPWRFKVVRDPERKKGLAGFTKYAAVIENAPVNICVFLDKEASYNREKDILATGAFIQNILLEAFSLGLGACWLGEILNRKEEVREYLSAPENLELVAVITLGYPAEDPGEGERLPVEALLLGD
ncbi:MAG: nitroreductase family protein [Candidatus Omnitrophica bacterium]|nr:nitroreductase family protein [Candidatus Omnitrophota bacterium]